MSKTYIPSSLSINNKKKQKNYIKKSKKLYKQNKYFIRPKIKNFKSKTSKHIIKLTNFIILKA